MGEFEVFVSADVEVDLERILDYVERHESPERADRLFEQLKKAILGLEEPRIADAPFRSCAAVSAQDETPAAAGRVVGLDGQPIGSATRTARGSRRP